MCPVPAAGDARPATPAPAAPSPRTRPEPRAATSRRDSRKPEAERRRLRVPDCPLPRPPQSPEAYPGGAARPLRACGLPLRGGAGRRGPREPEQGRGGGPGSAAQRRAMAAARAEKREAGRARRGPELRPALLEPAREQAEAEGGGGGGGRPGARRAREAVSAQPGRSGGETSSSCPARRASVLLSRPLSLTLSLPGWKFPLTSREQTDGRTHARARSGGGRWGRRRRGWGKPARPDPAPRAPSPAAAVTPPGGTQRPKGRPEQLEAT